MTLKSRLPTGAALAALLATPAVAQDYLDLGEIVLSPSLSPVEAGRTAQSIEVVDAETLARADSSTVQTLDRLPGVSFSANGGAGSAATLRIRGLNWSYIGVRYDGIDITDPSGTQTQYDFGGLINGSIGRIELLKGSQSALYGSEAVAGVVNLQSRRPEAPGFSGELSLEAGSEQARAASLWLGHKSERGEIALSYARSQTDGISARADNDEADGFEQSVLTLSARHAVTDSVTLGFSALARDSEVEIDRSAGDPSGENDTEQRGARVFAEIGTGAVDHVLSYSRYDTERRDPGGFTTLFDGSREELSYLGTANLTGGTVLSFGATRTEEEITTEGPFGGTGPESDTTDSLLAELLLRPSAALDLSIALRRDSHSTFGMSNAGRIAAAYRLRPDMVLRASAATGLRAPSLYETYSAYGNADLEPEESRSIDLGVEKTYADGSFVKATLFYSEITNLIGFDPAEVVCGSGFGCYGQVDGLTVSEGLELSGRAALSDAVALFGSYTLTGTDSNANELPRVPRHDLVLGLEADLGRSSASIEMRRVADVEASAFAPADQKVGDYTLFNASLGYDLTASTEAYLRVENLTDEDYETSGGYNMPGRSVFFGVRTSF